MYQAVFKGFEKAGLNHVKGEEIRGPMEVYICELPTARKLGESSSDGDLTV